MKRGLDYAFSAEKRAFDLTIAGAITPLTPLIGILLERHLRDQPIPEDRNPIFEQERVGAGGASFIIQKFRTLDSSPQEKSFGPLSARMRRYGIDELLQARNIRANDMSVVAHRAIKPSDLQAMKHDCGVPESVVTRWEEIVEPTKPGLLSTFTILNHEESAFIVDKAELKFDLDIQDVMEGSLIRDVQIIGEALKAAIAGRV